MSNPHALRNQGSASSFVRVNGKIRAREVRVIGADGNMIGILQLNDALHQARTQGLDLVEIAPTANPPVCRIVDYGKFRYEQAKRDKDAKKHQHATKVKEVQLSPTIDAHDFGVKKQHAIDFLCEEMKVKVTLKFRGREMMHQEFGFQTVKKFLAELNPWGHPDFEPKLLGRSLNAMISPLPRNKRAKNPNEQGVESSAPEKPAAQPGVPKPVPVAAQPPVTQTPPPSKPAGFANNPFAGLDGALAQ